MVIKMIFSCKFDARAYRTFIESADCVSDISFDKAQAYMDSGECVFFGIYNASELAAALLCFTFDTNNDGENVSAAYLCGFAQREKYSLKEALGNLVVYCIGQLKEKGIQVVLCPKNAPDMFVKKYGFIQNTHKIKKQAVNDGKKCVLAFKKVISEQDFEAVLDIYNRCADKNGIFCTKRTAKSFQSKLKLCGGQLYLGKEAYFIYDGRYVVEFMTLEDDEKLLKNIARFFAHDLECFCPVSRKNKAPEQLTLDIPGFEELASTEIPEDGTEQVDYAMARVLKEKTEIQDMYF